MDVREREPTGTLGNSADPAGTCKWCSGRWKIRDARGRKGLSSSQAPVGGRSLWCSGAIQRADSRSIKCDVKCRHRLQCEAPPNSGCSVNQRSSLGTWYISIAKSNLLPPVIETFLVFPSPRLVATIPPINMTSLLRSVARPSTLRAAAAASKPLRSLTTADRTFVRTKATLPDLPCMSDCCDDPTLGAWLTCTLRR